MQIVLSVIEILRFWRLSVPIVAHLFTHADFVTNFSSPRSSFIHGPSVRPLFNPRDHPCLPGFRLQRRLMDYPYIHPKYLSTTCHRFNGGPCAAHKNNNDSLFTQLIRRFYRGSWGGTVPADVSIQEATTISFSLRFPLPRKLFAKFALKFNRI